MQPVVLDTDVTSLILKGKLAGPLAGRLIGRKPLITFVTYGELAKWVEIPIGVPGAVRHWPTGSRASLSCLVMSRWPRLGVGSRPLPFNVDGLVRSTTCGSRPAA